MSEKCFFRDGQMATNDVIYHGYYGAEPHTKSYRGIIGLSIANFDITEEQIFLPRSSWAKWVHIISIFIKLSLFGLFFLYLDFHWFGRLLISFVASIALTQIFYFLAQTRPRNLYLYNLSSLVDFGIFLLPSTVLYFVYPPYYNYACIFSFIILFFVNGFTWSLKKYHLYKYPEELLSMYNVGFKHGIHPQFDNYLGFIVKPLRWFY